MLKLPTLPTNTEYANKNIFEAMEQLDKYEDENEVEYYSSSRVTSQLFAIYLRQKYKATCFDTNYLLYREIMFRVDYSQKITGSIITNILKEQTDIIERILDCIEKHEPLIVIPVAWIMRNGNEKVKNGHKNLLIYRDSLKQFELFEPHGPRQDVKNEVIKNNYINEIMRAFVRVIIMNLKIPTNIKYIPPNIVCPYLGFQGFEGRSKIKKLEREGGGYCALWSLYFMELVLKNPDIESSQIVSLFYSKLTALPPSKRDDFFRKLARAYSHIINEKLQRHFTDSTKVLKTGSTKEIIEFLKKNKSFDKKKFSIDIDKHVKKMGKMDLMTPDRKLKTSKCPEGLNPKTNKCIKINRAKTEKKKPEIPEKKPEIQKKTLKQKICPEGKILNPKTNRCIKINRAKTEKKKPEPKNEKKPEPKNEKKPEPKNEKKTLKKKICLEGKILNPKTNRCIKINRSKTEKKIEPNPEQRTCPEGKVLKITYKCVGKS